MARAGRIEVQVVGDTASLSRSFRQASRETGSFGTKLRSVSRAAGVAGLAITGGVAVALKSSVGAAKEAEVAQINLQAALKNANISYKDHAKEIDAAIQKTSRLAAIDDEDLSDAFSKLVRTTGSVTDATKGMALAADIARARHISLESATKFVEKALMGQVGALKRVGVTLPVVTDAQDKLKQKWKETSDTLKGKVTPAMLANYNLQLRQAVEADKYATKQNAIAEAQAHFAGAAEAYGKTSAAAQERFGVALENLQEQIGTKLLPVLTDLFTWGTEFLEWATVNWPKFEKVVSDVFENLKPPIQAVIDIMGTLKTAVESNWGFIERNFNAAKVIIKDVLKAITAALRLPIDLIHGDWDQAWKDAKTLVTAPIDAVKVYLQTAVENIKGYALAIGKGVKEGIKDGVTGIGEFVLNDVIGGLKTMLANQAETVKTSAVTFGKAILGGIVDGVTGVAAAVWTAVSAIVTKFVGMHETVVGWGLKLGGWIITGAASGVSGIAEAVWSVVKEIPGYLVEKIEAVGEWAKDIGVALKNKIVEGLEGIGEDIYNKIKSELKSWALDIAELGLKVAPGDGVIGADTKVTFGGGGNFPVPSASAANISDTLFDDLGLAQSMGLTLTSGYRPGAITSTGNPSLHGVYPSKAIDVAGSPAAMAAFFRAEIARGAPGIRELLYSPIGGYYPGVGIVPLTGSVLRDHYSHVHVGSYDEGGFLRPGWNLAWNGTGRPEPVGPARGAAPSINVTVHGYVGNDQDIAGKIVDTINRQQRVGRLRFAT